MAPVLWMWKAKMKFYLTGIILLLGVTLFASDLNDNNTQSRNISFGLTGTAGFNGFLSRGIDLDNNYIGFSAGGGLVFEKMFSNRLGLHSGLVYRYMENDLMSEDPIEPLDLNWSFHTLTIPFLMILAASTDSFSFNLLAGFSYINIFDSSIRNRSFSPGNLESQNALSVINPHQVAVTAGINFKFKVSKFSDFFVGIIGDFNPTNLFRADHGENEYLHIYGARIMTGFMFRTDVFPIPKKIL